MDTKHQQRIDRLISENPLLKTTQFRKNSIEFISRYFEDFGDDDRTALRSYIAFIPDAYEIKEDEGEVIVYEVIDTSRIDDIKKWKLAWAWYIFDWFDIELKLVVCDIYEGSSLIPLSEWLEEVTSSDRFPKGRPVSGV